ncbi:MAG TPA: hypothetical protein PKE04_14610, partial [Clostridia bacterium]|nr:hypothetical protein [Clostridia bacterium]
ASPLNTHQAGRRSKIDADVLVSEHLCLSPLWLFIPLAKASFSEAAGKPFLGIHIFPSVFYASGLAPAQMPLRLV